MKAAFLLGRMIFGGFFLYNGIHHFQERKALAQYSSGKGVPLPEVAVTASGALLLAGGVSLLLGVKPKWGTLAIMTFLAGVSPVMHDFWTVDDPNEKQNQMINFMKNLAMLGGALALMGVEEPWPLSLPIAQPTPTQRVQRFAREMVA
jgi:putative oxidoreductase